MKIKAALLATSTLFLANCTTTSSVSLSDYNKGGKKVTAKASGYNFLGLSPISLEKSSTVLDKLKSQCETSNVTGITSKTSFTGIILGGLETVEASAYCK